MNNDNNTHGNVQIGNEEISRKDIERAIHQIAYRKAYNNRPDVCARRKRTMKVRSERIKLAMEYIKQHPEVVA